jgi:acid phosphatase
MAQLVLSGQPFTEPAWQDWVKEARATALPGAVRFLNSAFLAGVAPVYITNRVCHPADPGDKTVQVLRQLRIPVRTDRLFCREKSSDSGDKSARRALVARSYRILMLFGDDLGDFVSVPKEESTVEARAKLLPLYENLLGERWFVIPNPMYGSWERAIGTDVETKVKALRR